MKKKKDRPSYCEELEKNKQKQIQLLVKCVS